MSRLWNIAAEVGRATCTAPLRVTIKIFALNRDKAVPCHVKRYGPKLH
jgi:hypothetical protein